MKINFISQFFDPEPTIRDLEFVKMLKTKGSKITVTTGLPNYPQGKIYDGYKKIFLREVIDDVNITRLPLIPSHSSSVFMRALNIISFFLSLTTYLVFFSKKNDITYAYHPPITIAFASLILKKIHKTPYVLDVLDLWPHSLISTKFTTNPIIIKVVSIITKLVYKHADHIVVTSPGMKNEIIKNCISEKKISVIYNSTPEKRLQTYKKINLEMPETELTLLYAGNIGPAQEIEVLIDVAKQLSIEKLKIKFIFVGTGILKEKIIKKSKDLNCDNVIFLPQVNINEVWNYYKAADIGIVKLSNDKLFDITIPGKTMSYMFFGLPILMIANGDAADLVNRANCGLTCNPDSKIKILETIRILYNKNKNELAQMGVNGKNFYASHLSTNNAVDKFHNIFASITK
jgi:colanic acid biosynthesis glycosyl transferase WcaI